MSPDTRFMAFTTSEYVGGNTCFLEGRLIIESRLSEPELEEFYTSRYGGKYWGSVDSLPVYPIGEKSDGLPQFGIRALAVMGDFSCWWMLTFYFATLNF